MYVRKDGSSAEFYLKSKARSSSGVVCLDFRRHVFLVRKDNGVSV